MEPDPGHHLVQDVWSCKPIWEEGCGEEGWGWRRQVTACVCRPQSLWNGPWGPRLGRSLKHEASVCVYAQTRADGFIERFHTRPPPAAGLFGNPPGDANGNPDPRRAGLEAAQTFLPGRIRPRGQQGQQDAAQGTRVSRGALCARFSRGNRPGAAGRGSGLTEASHPPAVTPSSPGPTTPGSSRSLPDLGLPARPGERIEVRGGGPRGMRSRQSPRLQAGGRRPLRGGGSFIEVPPYSAGPRDSPHYRRRRLRLAALGSKWPPESVPRWGHAVRLAVPRPRVAQRPATPPPIRSWRARSLASARGRRVAASARAPQPAHHRSSRRQQGLSPTLRFPGLSFPFREMGSHLGRWDAENTWG